MNGQRCGMGRRNGDGRTRRKHQRGSTYGRSNVGGKLRYAGQNGSRRTIESRRLFWRRKARTDSICVAFLLFLDRDLLLRALPLRHDALISIHQMTFTYTHN
jgi:hypothetical protein